MRLYLFEHCSLCFRVRMAAALKRRHLQETIVLDDDSATMVNLVGKRVIPSLVKDDGQPMLESMEMVAHIDGLGDPVLTGPQRAVRNGRHEALFVRALLALLPRADGRRA